MAYTQVGMVNLALTRIGVKRIAAMTENSNQALAATAVFDMVFDEVLEAKEWTFAKTRVQVGQARNAPLSGYDCAYILPSDFLRLAKSTEDDPCVNPKGYPYVIETQDVVVGDTVASDFLPTATYTYSATAVYAKVGKFTKFDFGGGKYLYVAAPYGLAGASMVKIAIATAGSDALAVATSGDTVTISLANTGAAKNYASLIQTALRAAGPCNGVALTSFIVTCNAAYYASPPIIGTIAGQGLSDGDYVYTLAATCTGSAQNTSYFPGDILNVAYWVKNGPTPAKVILTDFDDGFTTGLKLVVRYIRRLTDYAGLSPSFISAFAYRLAAELSLHLTEGAGKFKGMMELYFMALRAAEDVNQSMDIFDTVDTWVDKSTTAWVNAGRSASQS